jgi:anti-anti-sigma regulatory factor
VTDFDDGRSTLTVDHRSLQGATVVTPHGCLDVVTYARLRDALLKCAAEAPDALVVELGHLDVDRTSALSLFPTVWMRISAWPGIPLFLTAPHPELAERLRHSAVPRFVPCYPSTAAALDAFSRPPPRCRAEIELPNSPSSARWARVWVAAQLLEFGITGCRDVAVQVASELVGNVAQHTRSGCRLRLELHPAGLSVAVSDDDVHSAVVAPFTTPLSRGRGLAVVEALARAWGHTPRFGGGKVVWAVVPVPGGPAGPLYPGPPTTTWFPEPP